MPAGWLPVSLQELRHYSTRRLWHDVVAGVTVGLVALPLAMAFAIASGLSPQAGIYCAIVTGFLISALGGSRTQIGGPTGAFVVVVAGIVAQYGVAGLFMCTMMAGVILVVLGVTGMGTAVRFLPRPVVVGFTNGIAVLIASTQIRDLLGLRIEHVPAEFVPRLEAVARHLDTVNPAAAILGLTALALIVALRRTVPAIPGAIVALVAGTAVVMVTHLAVDTIGTRFGGIPAGFPAPHFPAFHAALIPTLIRPALTVAMLGAIESLMSAVVADQMTGDRHNPNVELVAQGIANIASPLFGGLPATGAIARTATNIRSGAQTPVAGMVHALTLLAVLLVAAPLASYIPHGGARRHPAGGVLQHGRVARDPEAAAPDQDGHQRLARHLRADRVRRPDAGRRSRDDPGRAALHPQGRRNHHGLGGDGRLRRGRPRPHPAGQA